MNSYSAVSGLREPILDNDGLSNTPDSEDDIRLPSNVLKRDRPSKLVDEKYQPRCPR